jgi:hypothetical protein
MNVKWILSVTTRPKETHSPTMKISYKLFKINAFRTFRYRQAARSRTPLGLG